MANMTDYLAWRGDIPISGIAPWNCIDALLMSSLCYLNFHGVDNPPKNHANC